MMMGEDSLYLAQEFTSEHASIIMKLVMRNRNYESYLFGLLENSFYHKHIDVFHHITTSIYETWHIRKSYPLIIFGAHKMRQECHGLWKWVSNANLNILIMILFQCYYFTIFLFLNRTIFLLYFLKYLLFFKDFFSIYQRYEHSALTTSCISYSHDDIIWYLKVF